MSERGVKVHRSVGLATVEVKRHRENRELGHDEQVNQHHDHVCAEQAVRCQGQESVKH